MGVTFGTPITSPAGGVNSWSTGSITVAAGEVLVVVVAFSVNNEPISTVVWNNAAQSLSLVNRRSGGSGATGNAVEVWELVSPSAGSGTITITTTGTPQGKVATAHTVSGAVAGAGWRSAAVVGGNTDVTPTLTISSETNDVSYAGLAFRNTTYTFSADASPVSQIATANSGSGSAHCGVRVLTETGAASTSPSGTLSTSTGWSMVGFNINAAPVATALSVTTQPSGAVDDTAFTTQPAVQVVDQFGAAFSVNGTTVTAAKQTGTGTLGGTTTANTNASGVATFTNLKITGTGAHTLRFTATGLTLVDSSSFTVAAAPSGSTTRRQTRRRRTLLALYGEDL